MAKVIMYAPTLMPPSLSTKQMRKSEIGACFGLITREMPSAMTLAHLVLSMTLLSTLQERKVMRFCRTLVAKDSAYSVAMPSS